LRKIQGAIAIKYIPLGRSHRLDRCPASFPLGERKRERYRIGVPAPGAQQEYRRICGSLQIAYQFNAMGGHFRPVRVLHYNVPWIDLILRVHSPYCHKHHKDGGNQPFESKFSFHFFEFKLLIFNYLVNFLFET